MGRPFRRYSFSLAERLGRTLQELYNELSVLDILEWMAYDKTSNPEWVKKYQHEQELEKSKKMTVDEKVEAFKRMLGAKPKDGGNGNNRKLDSRN